jgi:hypothetical protein
MEVPRGEAGQGVRTKLRSAPTALCAIPGSGQSKRHGKGILPRIRLSLNYAKLCKPGAPLRHLFRFFAQRLQRLPALAVLGSRLARSLEALQRLFELPLPLRDHA